MKMNVQLKVNRRIHVLSLMIGTLLPLIFESGCIPIGTSSIDSKDRRAWGNEPPYYPKIRAVLDEHRLQRNFTTFDEIRGWIGEEPSEIQVEGQKAWRYIWEERTGSSFTVYTLGDAISIPGPGQSLGTTFGKRQLWFYFLWLYFDERHILTDFKVERKIEAERNPE